MVRALLVVLLVAGCPGSKVRPHKPGEVWLSTIRVEGNKSIDYDDLVDGLSLERIRRDGRAVEPYQLKLDTRRIEGAYLRMGFFDAKVSARIDRDDFAETVVFTVVEGPRVKARVDIAGLPPEIAKDYALAKLPLREGEPFDYELYEDGKLVLQGLVEEAGYARVYEDSVVTVDRKAGVAFASYRIESGELSTFGKVTIVGVSEDSDLYAAIRGRMLFDEGGRYSPRALAETHQALYDLQRFSQVRIEPDRKAAGAAVPITIQVAVGGRAELILGGGFGYEPLTYEARARAAFSYVPDEYPLRTYSVDFRGGLTVTHTADKAIPFFDQFDETSDYNEKIRLLFSLQKFEFLRPFIVADVTAPGFDFFTVEAYTARGGFVRFGATSPLGKRWLTLRLGYQWSYLNFDNISEALDDRRRFELGLRGDQFLGKYEQTVAADLRDNPLEPRKGAFLSLRLIEGSIVAGGEFEFLQLEPELRLFYPLGRVVVAGRLRGGIFLGDVPVTERYFSGGAQSHRGFSARGLSPFEFNDVPIDPNDPSQGTRGAKVAVGGEAFVETGLELRIPIVDLSGLLLGVTLFLDGGDVPADPDDLDLTNLHWAAGTGMFLKLGSFKIRFDFGHRISRRVSDGFVENTLFSLGVGDTY